MNFFKCQIIVDTIRWHVWRTYFFILYFNISIECALAATIISLVKTCWLDRKKGLFWQPFSASTSISSVLVKTCWLDRKKGLFWQPFSASTSISSVPFHISPSTAVSILWVRRYVVISYNQASNQVRLQSLYMCSGVTRRVWRYQRGNQNPSIEEEQTTQWPRENVQKDKQRSTKHTHTTKDQVTQHNITPNHPWYTFLFPH